MWVLQESPVGMKTGVLSRLNQWEKGAVGGSSPADKTKSKVSHIFLVTVRSKYI